jgi:hypothetical protein
MADMRVVDGEGDEVDAAPNEGAGVVRKYFDVTPVAKAKTDVSGDEAWAFLAAHPPHSPRPAIDLPPMAAGDFDLPLAALIQRLYTVVATTEADELPPLFRDFLLPGLFRRFPRGSLWYVSVDRALPARLTFMRLALQFKLTPDVDFLGDEKRAFFNAHQLGGDVAVSALMSPILTLFSPVVTGFAMNVAPHAFVFLFGDLGEEEDMRTHGAGPLARAFYPSVNDHSASVGIKVPTDDLPTAHVESLLGWWTSRLNVVYSHAADPTRHATAAGLHDVAAQAAWLYTFERMLADLIALSASVDSPPLLRMQTAFDALDKAAALLAAHGDSTTDAFRRLLQRDETLPRLRAAFDGGLPLQLQMRFKSWGETAFEQLYKDIAASTMVSRQSPTGVRVGYRAPDDLREVPWPEYVGRLMREARNASHGLLDMLAEMPGPKYKSHKGPPRPFLLATNSGTVPASLFEVTRVIVFGLMSDPARLCTQTW